METVTIVSKEQATYERAIWGLEDRRYDLKCDLAEAMKTGNLQPLLSTYKKLIETCEMIYLLHIADVRMETRLGKTE